MGLTLTIDHFSIDSDDIDHQQLIIFVWESFSKIKPHRIGITILVTWETSYAVGDFWDNPIIHGRPQHCTEHCTKPIIHGHQHAFFCHYLEINPCATLASSDMAIGQLAIYVQVSLANKGHHRCQPELLPM